jgi:hypothetical protein
MGQVEVVYGGDKWQGRFPVAGGRGRASGSAHSEFKAHTRSLPFIEVRDLMRQLGTVDQSKVLDDMATRP